MDTWPDESLRASAQPNDHPEPGLPRLPTEEELTTPAQTEVWNAALEKIPSDYLLAAKGDVRAAAREANVDRATFIRALSADSSLPRVAKSIHFMALLGSLELLQLAQEGIVSALLGTRAHPDPDDEPLPSVKELLAVFKVSSDFISMSNMHQNPGSSRPNRHTPPSKGAIMEASRGLPTATFPSRPATPQASPSDAQDSDERLEALRTKLAQSSPEVQALVADALQVAADIAQQETDDPELDGYDPE